MGPVATTAPPSHRYLELINLHPLRPIRSEAEVDRASDVLDGLLTLALPTADDTDYIEVLGDLIERYELSAHPIPRSTDAQMLQFLMESRGVSAVELGHSTGIAEAAITAVLDGKQGPTASQIDTLATYFHVSPEVFASGQDDAGSAS